MSECGGNGAALTKCCPGGPDESYLAFLDSVPVPVWLTHVRGHCKFLNRALLALLEKSLEQALSEGWQGFEHPDDLPSISGHTGIDSRRQLEIRMRTGTGDYRWFLCTVAPVHDYSGQICCCTGYLIDISEFKGTGESLYRIETRYRQLFDSNLIGVMYTSVSGGILDANRKFLE